MTIMGSVDISFTNSTKIAKGAEQTANTAQETANGAAQTAGQAQATAETASQTATQAASTANSAQQTADTALQSANGKNTNYYGQDEPASGKDGDLWFKDNGDGTKTVYQYINNAWSIYIDQNASDAAQAAADAQSAADNAAQVGSAAQSTANAAAEAAATAQQEANVAASAASNAQVSADSAQEAAENAQTTANDAASAAADAQTAANNAASAASAAQTTANDAKTIGQSAQTTADQATSVANSASSAANTAKQQAESAVSTANQATQNAQNAINKAQDGFDKAQDALTAANNATDTANTAKQVASDAATQAGTAKANAQTAMSNAQDAINKANAANDNANTREKSIIKSNTAPSNPATDQLWIDTSKTPQIMRRWNGSTWVDLSPTQANQIGAVSSTTYTTDITNINNTLSQKASVTTVNTLSERVDEAETAITQNANDIALKADKNVVDTLKNIVDNHSTLISQNADAIALKASQSTVDALTGRVSTAEATLTTQANQIAARITKTDADAKYATQTALTATANSLTSNISAVQTNLDNLQIGGANLAPNSTGDLGTDGWRTFNSSTNLVVSDGYQGHKSVSVTVPSANGAIYTPFGNVEGSGQYTMSFWVKADKNCTVSHLPKFLDSNNVETNPLTGSSVNLIANTWTKVEYTFIAPSSAVKAATTPRIGSGTFPTNLFVSRYKLEKGAKATDWTPAPEDMATRSQITQLANDINLRVKQNDVINQINISTEGILIDGKKVHITGQTTIDNAVITSAMIKSVSASTITTGTLDASVVTVTKINASNITTGTLNTNLLSAGSIDATKIKAGTLTTASGVFGDISASSITSGTLSADRIGANTITADKLIIGDFINYAAFPDKSNAKTSPWDTTAVVDTSKYHTNVSSLKIAPNNVAIKLKNNIPVQPGDVIYYSFWIVTDSNWNGTSGNSKLRFGDQNGALLTAIGYDGAKTSWTQYSGTYTIPSGVTYLQMTIGNDGSTGNVWLDDIVLQKQMGAVSIQNGAITGTKIAANTIDASNIKAGTLTSASGVFGAISANNITTGTLNAANVTVTNLNASNISTGTLNAARIGAGTIDATKLSVSTLSAISANLGSVTAGTLTGVTINAGTFNSSGERGSLTISQDSLTTTKTTVSGSTTTIETIETFGGSMLFNTEVNSTITSETLIDAGSVGVINNNGSTNINGGSITTSSLSVDTVTSSVAFQGLLTLNYGSSEVSALVSSGQIQSVSFWSTGASTFNQILTGNLTASRGGAINLNNGDIIGANGIYLNDAANVDGEGIVFPWSTSTNVLDVTQADCLRAYNGRLLLNGDVVHTEKSMMIATGYVVITPSAANTPTYKTISFGKTFPVVPTVVVTPNSTVAGTTITGWAVTDVTTTGCKIWVTRGNTTDTGIQWIAIADNTAWTANAVG